jgi:hypothetical protein
MLKRIALEERGRTLPWTLVVMAIGALLLPSFLARTSASLIACRAIEAGLKEQYAADSGVEYALWQLQNGITTGEHSYNLNDKTIGVTWGEHITDTYKIISTASGHTDGGSTTIESYVSLQVAEPPAPPEAPLDSPEMSVEMQADGEADDPVESDATVELQILTYHIYP